MDIIFYDRTQRDRLNQFLKKTDDLKGVGGDVGKVEGLYELIEQMDTRLVEVQHDISALRPIDKDYQKKLDKLTTEKSALESQIVSMLDEVEETLKETRVGAFKHLKDEVLNGLEHDIEICDREALDGLLKAYDALDERTRLEKKFQTYADVFARISSDYKYTEGIRDFVKGDIRTCFLAKSPRGAHEKVLQYVDHLRKVKCTPPEDDKFAWFCRANP